MFLPLHWGLPLVPLLILIGIAKVEEVQRWTGVAAFFTLMSLRPWQLMEGWRVLSLSLVLGEQMIPIDRALCMHLFKTLASRLEREHKEPFGGTAPGARWATRWPRCGSCLVKELFQV